MVGVIHQGVATFEQQGEKSVLTVKRIRKGGELHSTRGKIRKGNENISEIRTHYNNRKRLV